MLVPSGDQRGKLPPWKVKRCSVPRDASTSQMSPSRPTAIWLSSGDTTGLAVELRVGGLPDLAHAALAEQGGHVVVAEAGAGAKGHGRATAARTATPRMAGGSSSRARLAQ